MKNETVGYLFAPGIGITRTGTKGMFSARHSEHPRS